MIDEKMLFKIQALADNELPSEEIPEVMSAVEGNYLYRNEYIQLLQLKQKLANVSFPAPPLTWYKNFETRASRKIFMFLGTAFMILGTLGFIGQWFMTVLNRGESYHQSIQVGAGFSLALGVIFFLIQATWYKIEESKGKSYKEIIR